MASSQVPWERSSYEEVNAWKGSARTFPDVPRTVGVNVPGFLRDRVDDAGNNKSTEVSGLKQSAVLRVVLLKEPFRIQDASTNV